MTTAPCSLMLSPSVREVLALLVGGGVTATGVIVLLRAPGPVAQPVPDRWHRKATPLIGGLALLSGFLAALGVVKASAGAGRRVGYLAAGATAAFLVGLADDERWIRLRTKFAGQLAIGGAPPVSSRTTTDRPTFGVLNGPINRFADGT